MKPYIITSDSMSDLPRNYLSEHGIPVVSLTYTIDGQTYDWDHELPYKEFYARMRAGSMPTTAQIVPDQAKELFAKLIGEGYEIIHVAFSSAMSGSYQSAVIAATEILEEMPEARITVIDSLCASLGQGLLIHKMVQMKEGGAAYEEVCAWAEEHKLEICHNFTVDNLFHLYRGGRVSRSSAVFGTMLSIKPLLHVDDEGRLINIDKTRGRKKSLRWLVDRMCEQIQGYDNDIFFISHGDCLEEAEYVAQLVEEKTGIKNHLISHVGPTIGAHSGPGTMALFFLGRPR